jgi:hypothetical protein
VFADHVFAMHGLHSLPLEASRGVNVYVDVHGFRVSVFADHVFAMHGLHSLPTSRGVNVYVDVHGFRVSVFADHVFAMHGLHSLPLERHEGCIRRCIRFADHVFAIGTSRVCHAGLAEGPCGMVQAHRRVTD